MKFLELASSRRSVRSYKDKEVSRELLEQIMEATRWSPSAGNLQPCYYYVASDKETVTRIFTESLPKPSWHLEVPACVIISVEFDISAQRYGDRGQYIYCLQDSGAAAQSILLAAHDLGLGACWVGAFDTEKCSKSIGLNSKQTPVAIIALGHPERIPEPTPRKESEDIITWIG